MKNKLIVLNVYLILFCCELNVYGTKEGTNNFTTTGDIYKDEFLRWEQKIQNFEPESLLTIKIPRKDKFIFYEEISITPCTVVVAFYVHQEDEKIDFEVYNKKKIIGKIRGKNRDFYEFNVTRPSTFGFHLLNERVKIC